MNDCVDIPTSETRSGSHGHKPRERTDIASGQVCDPDRLIRIAFGPQGQLIPDLGQKLPGRGAWITPSRDAIVQAAKSGAFARAANAKVDVPTDFADMIEAGLRARIVGLLGMANRAGGLEYGFDKVRTAAGNGALIYRFEARDGASDGRGKIRVLAKAVARELETKEPLVIGCFDGHELGAILGRDHMVHVGVKSGRFNGAFHHALSRLHGFVDFIPKDWEDRSHETPFQPF